MKVLVRIPVTCTCCFDEALEEAQFEQLVIFRTCTECFPDQNDWVGMEDDQDYQRAVVIDRPDLNAKSYEHAIRVWLRRHLEAGSEDRRRVVDASQGIAKMLSSIAEDFPVGTTLERRGNQVFYDAKQLARVEADLKD